MSIANVPTLPPEATYTDEPVFRLSVEQYHDLISLGKLTTEDPVELIEGILVFKMPKDPTHSAVTEQARETVVKVLPPGWRYRVQEPVTLLDGEPEPDGAVVRGSIRDFMSRHPGPPDIALIIEVANTTLARDRGIKMRSYARSGVAQYWILNLIDWQVEAYADPAPAAAGGPMYRNKAVHGPGKDVPLAVGGEVIGAIAVNDLLPPR